MGTAAARPARAAVDLSRARSLARSVAYGALAAVNRLVPKQAGRVVLHSTTDVEDGILALLEELRRRGHDGSVLLEDPCRAARLDALAGHPIDAVPRRSIAGVLRFLRARYVVTTEHLYGNGRPPASQTVVNIWHGEPGAKVIGRFGAGLGGIRCTYAPVTSAMGRAFRAASFDISPRQVPIIGAARNDRMLRSDGASARRALLGGQSGGTALLWLPSYRVGRFGRRQRVDSAGAQLGLPFAPADLHRLDDWLTERGARLVVKPHPHDAADVTGDYRSLQVLTSTQLHDLGLTTYTALPAFDGLITDVSSVWWDYLLLDKPLLFAFPDVAAYREGRGLNLEPYEQWLPGPFATTLDELLVALDDVVSGRDPMADERRRALARFHRYADDGSSGRLLDTMGLFGGPPRPAG